MTGNLLHRDLHAQVPFGFGGDAVPIEMEIGVVERNLGLPGGFPDRRVAVDRDTGAVRPPVRHLFQHGREVGAQPDAHIRILEIEADNAAHVARPGILVVSWGIL